jgi:hypothetical protein
MNDRDKQELPPINKRIKELVDKFSGGNVSNFIELIKFNKHQNFNRMFNIDNRNGKFPSPSAEILNSIKIHLPEIDYDWLLTGEGEMLKGDSPAQTTTLVGDVTVSREAWDMIKLQIQTINNQQQALQMQQTTIQAQQQTIEFLTKRDDTAGNAQAVNVG